VKETKLTNIQGACGQLVTEAKIDPAAHKKTTGDNVKSLNAKSKQHGI
jgi:hypothetical protein